MTGEELIEQFFSKSDYEPSTLKAESYAVASFVIEQFWDYLKQRFSTESLRLEGSKETGNTTSQRFALSLTKALNTYRDQYVEYARQSLKNKEDKEMTKSDLFLLKYFQLRHEGKEAPGVPSMNDLVSLIGRMGDVVPKVYERDLKRQPTDDELFSALDHPSLKRLFMELMTNSREAASIVLILLEGGEDFDLDDPTREFDPKYFLVKEFEKGERSVILRPEVAQRFRDVSEAIADTRARDGNESPRALQCPVLYTGAYVEMHEWVVSEFKKFYAEEPITKI